MGLNYRFGVWVWVYGVRSMPATHSSNCKCVSVLIVTIALIQSYLYYNYDISDEYLTMRWDLIGMC